MTKLPNADGVVVDRRKLVEYLLSRTHPVGRSKAEFFGRLGFTDAHADDLELELKRIGRDEEVAEAEDTNFGTKYIVPGQVSGPEATAAIITVWILDRGAQVPRFVTAYPAE